MSSPDWSRVRGASVGDTKDDVFGSPHSQHTETYDGNISLGEHSPAQLLPSISSSAMNPAAPEFLPYHAEYINAQSVRASNFGVNALEVPNDATFAAIHNYPIHFPAQTQNRPRDPRCRPYQSYRDHPNFDMGTQQRYQHTPQADSSIYGLSMDNDALGGYTGRSHNPRSFQQTMPQQGLGARHNGIVLISYLRQHFDKAEDELRHAQNRMPPQGSGD
ncbi:hypothetical protein LTS18_002870, partial [Coniosporium uncinatum]